MHLIAKNGARIKVESHAVCSHSTLLGARIIEGAIVIKVDHEERVVQQMVDWMHRTGGENHLTGGLSLDQIAAIGPSEVSTKLLALVDVGKIAIEYEVFKLRDAVVELMKPLVLKLTSVKDVLAVIYKLLPKNVPTPLLQALTYRAQNCNEEQLESLAASAKRSVTTCDRAVQTAYWPPLPMYQPPPSMLRRPNASAPSPSPTTIATSSAQKRRADRNDSTQEATTTALPSNNDTDDDKGDSNGDDNGDNNDDDDDNDNNDDDYEEDEEEAPSPPTSRSAKRQRINRNDPSRISTALPRNSPPLGDYCDCKVAESDPHIVRCVICKAFFHPRCVGRGRYGSATYATDPAGYMTKDVDYFEVEEFACRYCKPGFFDATGARFPRTVARTGGYKE